MWRDKRQVEEEVSVVFSPIRLVLLGECHTRKCVFMPYRLSYLAFLGNLGILIDRGLLIGFDNDVPRSLLRGTSLFCSF